jgi:hypothetical protein
MKKLFCTTSLLLVIMILSGFKSRPYVDINFQNPMSFGYQDKGDSIEFHFGEQKIIKVGILEIDLDKRRNEIKQVNLAGDFNGWNPNNAMFIMKKTDNKLYTLIVPKKSIGKKGEIRQFKFVLNGKYWIEPPSEALNKISGSDHNTNLYVKL